MPSAEAEVTEKESRAVGLDDAGAQILDEVAINGVWVGQCVVVVAWAAHAVP